MILLWEGTWQQRQIKLDKFNNCGFIQSSLTYARWQKFANSMSIAVEQIKDKINLQRPKFKIIEELDGYQPVTPFDLKEDQEYDLK